MITKIKDFELYNEKKIGSSNVCDNLLCFDKKLKKLKFNIKNNNYKVRVIIKGDGDILERTFDIEIPTGEKNINRSDFETTKEYKDYLEAMKDYETSVIGWNLFGEESEWKEIFYSDIEDIIEDLNK